MWEAIVARLALQLDEITDLNQELQDDFDLFLEDEMPDDFDCFCEEMF